MRKSYFIFILLFSVTSAGVAPVVAATDNTKQTSQVVEATQLIMQFSKGDFKSCQRLFTAKMQQVLPPLKLQAVWKELIGQAGSFQGTGKSSTADSGPYHIVFLKSKFKNTTLWEQVVYDKTGKIAGLFYKPSSSLEK